jgi:Uma2 family endonuclease
MSAAAKLQSFDELYAAVAAMPEGQHGEILGPGWVRAMSRPSGKHSSTLRGALRALGDIDTKGGGDWWIDAEREIVFGRDKLYVPDLAGWHVGPDDPLAFVDENPVTRRPDWACEILSRGTQRADRAIKLPTYATCGVGHVWIVDVEAETIEVYAAHEGKPLLVATARGEQEVELPPFGLPISVHGLAERRAAKASRPGST